jgi:ribosomal protein S18 acetylase RimI-like enzyme
MSRDRVTRATIDDLNAVVAAQQEFWGERDMSHLHHPMLVHEFGATSVVISDPDDGIVAYLLGFVTLEGVAYAHLVAVRGSHRREGLGRELYGAFEKLARERGASHLKAYTRPANAASIDFHRSIGMTVAEVPDYAGPGETRVVFRRELE